jgi:hypothetical protein
MGNIINKLETNNTKLLSHCCLHCTKDIEFIAYFNASFSWENPLLFCPYCSKITTYYSTEINRVKILNIVATTSRNK